MQNIENIKNDLKNVLEFKTYTTDHDNQLERYKEEFTN